MSKREAFKKWEKQQEQKALAWISCFKKNFSLESESCQKCEIFSGCRAWLNVDKYFDCGDIK